MIPHIFDLYEQDFKPFSKSKASGWNGPCPKCGGRKHFVLFREVKRRKSKCPQLGCFSCRECGWGGDAIEYLMVVREMTYPAAAEACGVALEDRHQPGSKPRRKRAVPGLPPLPQQQHRQEFKPQESTFGPQVENPSAWIEHGEKFVEQCHAALLNSREAAPARAWLAARGISERLIILFRVGYHHGERVKGKDRQPTYRMAAAWGMPGLTWQDGNPRPKFVIHAGIVIPCYPEVTAQGVAGLLRRIAVRRPVGHPKYSQVEGSQGSVKAQMIIDPGHDVAVIVESELDGIALSGLLDGITIIPINSISGRPCVAVNRELRHKSLILIALDRDKDGANTTDWWLKNYRQAQPWCCPAGSFWVHPAHRRDGDGHGKLFKDTGDTIKAGCDQRAWAAEGIALYAANAPAMAKDDFLPQKKEAQLTGAGKAGKIEAAELLAFCILWPEHAAELQSADAVKNDQNAAKICELLLVNGGQPELLLSATEGHLRDCIANVLRQGGGAWPWIENPQPFLARLFPVQSTLPPAPPAVLRLGELLHKRGAVLVKEDWLCTPDYRAAQGAWTESERDEAFALLRDADVVMYFDRLPDGKYTGAELTGGRS